MKSPLRANEGMKYGGRPPNEVGLRPDCGVLRTDLIFWRESEGSATNRNFGDEWQRTDSESLGHGLCEFGEIVEKTDPRQKRVAFYRDFPYTVLCETIKRETMTL